MLASLASATAKFYLTYEELKQGWEYDEEQMPLKFYLTYEELKLAIDYTTGVIAAEFYLTYEELKHGKRYIGQRKFSNFILPMRN